MAFFDTKVEQQGNKERDQQPAKLQVERHYHKQAHKPSRDGAWEMLQDINDARSGTSLTF